MAPFDLKMYLHTANGDRTITNYKKNQRVYAQGDPCDAVYFILDGQVKITVISDQGKEAVVALQGEGDFFGEGSLTGQPKRLASVTAHVDSRIMRLPDATIRHLLNDEPAFSELFMTYLLTRNSRVEADLIDQLFNNSEKRLARLLLLMANFGKDDGPQPITTKVSQETMAEMIGSTRSRVNGFLNKFRDLGFIEYNGDMKVHSGLLNVVLHD
jgi:CRP/FNR family transcriptional regulator, cyclic AMP receptor protein